MHLIHQLDEINLTLRVCLVEWILGRLKKERERENDEEELFGGCLVGGEEGKMMVRPWCFLPGLIKKFSPQNGEKTG